MLQNSLLVAMSHSLQLLPGVVVVNPMTSVVVFFQFTLHLCFRVVCLSACVSLSVCLTSNYHGKVSRWIPLCFLAIVKHTERRKINKAGPGRELWREAGLHFQEPEGTVVCTTDGKKVSC